MYVAQNGNVDIKGLLKRMSIDRTKQSDEQPEATQPCYSTIPANTPSAHALEPDEEHISRTLTSRIAYDKVRSLLADQPDHGPSRPWKLVRDSLPRQPVVLLAQATASTGDRHPFFRVVLVRFWSSSTAPTVELTFHSGFGKTLPGQLTRATIIQRHYQKLLRANPNIAEIFTSSRFPR